ncbi:MAG: sulfite exporter TauE/SafE family protein [Actinomycetaceae bacterium]|nr:sulfite exporter TauE/SafE family protein [Actinomycetaceae bacterium]
MFELSGYAWLLIGLAAFFIGVSKTALPGLATLSVAIFAAVIPARESTAVMLVLLLTGDLIAIWTYRHDAHWPTLRRLIPTVVIGILVGAWFLQWADDLIMRRSIGWILIALTALTLLIMYRKKARSSSRINAAASGSARVRPDFEGEPGDALAGKGEYERLSTRALPRYFYGILGGFTTMAANAGGPVMTLYFLWARFPVLKFLGTQAWFFFIINVIKLPFSFSIGLINPATLRLDLALVPLVLTGALLGRVLAKRMNQKIFEPIVIVLTIISSIYLVV